MSLKRINGFAPLYRKAKVTIFEVELEQHKKRLGIVYGNMKKLVTVTEYYAITLEMIEDYSNGNSLLKTNCIKIILKENC